MEKAIEKGRMCLMALLGNEALFLLAAYLLRGILFIDPFKWHMESMTNLYAYILCPWGGYLIAARLYRLKMGQKAGREMPLLFILFAWISVPLLWRFGATFNNVVTDIGYAIVFFGLYASIRELPEEERGRRLSEMSVLFTILGLIWGSLLLYCAVTGTVWGQDTGGEIFGVKWNLLYCGVHYNSLGMMASGCLFMALALFERNRNIALRILGLLTALILILCIILSQSRTARYAMLIAFSIGVFLLVFMRAKWRAPVRLLVSLVLSAAVLVGGYELAGRIMDLALTHYANLANGKAFSADAYVETMMLGSTEALAEEAEVKKGEARVAVDATFSERTRIWENLFELWRSDVKNLVIGRGVGNTGSLIAHGTSHEADGTAAVHNTFLQFIADFGVIGLLLQLLFLLYILPMAFRGFLSGAKGTGRGLLSIGMLACDILCIGMMESAPLGQMTPTNLMLYTSLALLVASGDRALQK